MYAKKWTVDLYVSEEGDVTKVRAVLHGTDGGPVEGHGSARRNPIDTPVAEIGDEIAAGRALLRLGGTMLRLAEEDIEVLTRQPAHIGT